MASKVQIIFEGIDRVSNEVSGIGRSMDGLKRTALRVGAALAATFGVREIIEQADTYQLLQNRLKLVTDGTEALAAVTDELFKVAQRTRSSYEGTVDLFARVARSSDVLGISQSRLLRVTETINKSIQISGATTQEAAAGVIQFAQGLASGALRGDELRSVMEQMPGLARAIANGMGITIGRLRELGAEGALSGKAVIDALEGQEEVIANEFSQMEITVGQSMQGVKNSFLALIGSLDQGGSAIGGVGDIMKEMLGGLSDGIGALILAGDTLESDRSFESWGTNTAITFAFVADSARTSAFVVTSAFEAAGKLLAALAAQTTQFVQGNSDEARAIGREFAADMEALFQGVTDFDATAVRDQLRKSLAAAAEGATEGVSGSVDLTIDPLTNIDFEIPTDILETQSDLLEDQRKLFSDITETVRDSTETEVEELERKTLALQNYVNLLRHNAPEGYRISADAATEMMNRIEQNFSDSMDNLSDADGIFETLTQATETDREAIERRNDELEEYVRILTEDVSAGAEISAQAAETFLERIGKKRQEELDELGQDEDWAVDLEQLGKRAAENIQDSFADFLFDPFEDGVKGMAKAFIDVIRRMIAEALAAKLLKSLFGDKDEDSGSTGGSFLSTILGAVFREDGGPLSTGQLSVVGEREAELFVPKVDGEILNQKQIRHIVNTVAPNMGITPDSTFGLSTGSEGAVSAELPAQGGSNQALMSLSKSIFASASVPEGVEPSAAAEQISSNQAIRALSESFAASAVIPERVESPAENFLTSLPALENIGPPPTSSAPATAHLGSLIPGLATGGFTDPNTPTLVNEQEPEVLITKDRSQVVPLSQAAATGIEGKGGGGTFAPETHYHITASPMSQAEMQLLLSENNDMLMAQFQQKMRDGDFAV